MDLKEHLLVCLQEEALETNNEIIAPLKLDRDEQIEKEFNELRAVYKMLQDRSVLAPDNFVITGKVNTSLNPELEISEMCSSLQYYLSKSLRFGLDDIHPLLKKTNKELIEEQYNILIPFVQYNADHIIVLWDDEKLKDKQNRVLDWMEYARKKGTLVDDK